MEIGQRLDGLTGTGGRQRQTQAKRRDDALAATKLRLGATGIEQRFRKHPLELVSHHAKLSVIHRGLLSWSPKPHIQQEFRMDRKKNPQQIKYLKVPTYEQVLRWCRCASCSGVSWTGYLGKGPGIPTVLLIRHKLGGLSYVRPLFMSNPLRISCALY